MKRNTIIATAALALSISAQAQIMTLKDCLEAGIRESYQIRLVNISEEKAANNDSWAYAGGMPTVSVSGSYSGSLSSNDATLKSDGSTVSNRGVLDQTLNAQIRADWTVFEGFSIQATRDRMQELHNQGTIQTRVTIEDYIANLTTEYYNLVKQTLHLKIWSTPPHFHVSVCALPVSVMTWEVTHVWICSRHRSISIPTVPRA